MKNTLRLTLIAGLVALGVAQGRAQSTNTNVITFTTNMQQQVTVTLTGYTGGASNATGVANVRIANKDLISSLATATGVPFSPKAKLIAITPLGVLSNSGPFFLVQDSLSGTNVNTDVTPFFSASIIGTPVVKAKTSSNGKVSGTEWSITSFSFGSTGADTNGPPATTIVFDMQGFTTANLSSGAFKSTVNGPGSINLLDSVLQGKITTSAGKISSIQVPSP